MAIQNQPTRISIPFAASGTKNVIPNTQPSPSASQAASWTDGFPAQCSLPLSAGGIPPARADFNGILNAITQSERFMQEGGIFAWDASVDYDARRLVRGSNGGLYWSVAQSGPGLSAGAQNPVTDSSHTYWHQLATSDISSLVHIAGAETITGQKTFSQPIIGTATKSEGIAQYSSSRNYTYADLVMTPNGVLHFAVQASGPGTAAGVKDPALDDGTYWSAPLVQTPLLGDDSKRAANTEWVRDAIDSSGLVHIAGAETITGQKTFSQPIIGTATKSEGIAQFSSSTKYTYADLVMDPSGVLYFAAQESGPGTTAGVKDPASDDGTYWTTLLSQTPPLSNNSKRAANTGWVRSIAVAPVYMDPNGSDSNDGMSAASPVKTFSKAIGIGAALPHGSFTIVVAGGDYYGDAWVSDRKHCTLEIQGNTTIHGTLNVTQYSSLLVKNNSHNFSVDGQVDVLYSSYLSINGTFYIGYTGSGSGNAIHIERNSSFYVSNGITATVTNTSHVISCSLNSSVFITGAMSAIANNIQTSVFSAYNGSIIVFGSGVILSGAGNKYAFVSETRSGIVFSGNATNVYVPTGSVTASAVRIADAGFIYFSQSLAEVSLASPGVVVSCEDNSYAYFGCTTTLRKTDTGGVIVGCYNGGLVHLSNQSAILYIIGTTNNVALYASYGSKIIIGCDLDVSGDYANAVVVCFGLSVFKINYESTVTGNATGKKFYVSNLSMIDTGNAGTNRLPGDASGTIDSATFGVYN